MHTLIRKAQLADIPAIHLLVHELAVYEKAGDQVLTTESTFIEDFKNGAFDAVVAIHPETGALTGMALYYIAYSTWKGKYLWLEDFVVRADYRRFGIGKMLFDAILKIAEESNAFMKFQVLDWNTPAMQFYDTYEVDYEREWITCRKWLHPKTTPLPD